MLRGSEQLTKDIRAEAVTYKRVILVLANGQSILECGHTSDHSERNPAEHGQARYCVKCTHIKLARTGDA